MNKFKLWLKDEKRMTGEGGYFIETDGSVWMNDVKVFNGVRSNDNLVEITDNVEVLWFIDRKDKQGKEIYKGDIISYIDFTHDTCMLSDDKLIGQVNWYPSKAAFVLQEIKMNHKLGHYITSWGFVEKMEIIGNKFQHPELLKETK